MTEKPSPLVKFLQESNVMKNAKIEELTKEICQLKNVLGEKIKPKSELAEKPCRLVKLLQDENITENEIITLIKQHGEMKQHLIMLKEVYEKFKTNPGFMILSHTVDPDRDSVSVMKKYSGRYDAELPGWQFLTGRKDSLYQCASKDYLLAVEDSSSSSFIHTQYVALLDKKRQIRGFYDLTNKENISKLDAGIKQLLKDDGD